MWCEHVGSQPVVEMESMWSSFHDREARTERRLDRNEQPQAPQTDGMVNIQRQEGFVGFDHGLETERIGWCHSVVN